MIWSQPKIWAITVNRSADMRDYRNTVNRCSSHRQSVFQGFHHAKIISLLHQYFRLHLLLWTESWIYQTPIVHATNQIRLDVSNLFCDRFFPKMCIVLLGVGQLFVWVLVPSRRFIFFRTLYLPAEKFHTP